MLLQTIFQTEPTEKAAPLYNHTIARCSISGLLRRGSCLCAGGLLARQIIKQLLRMVEDAVRPLDSCLSVFHLLIGFLSRPLSLFDKLTTTRNRVCRFTQVRSLRQWTLFVWHRTS
jgi:hypothetical protein